MKRIAIVATNNGQYHCSRTRTGLWLSELTHFYSLLKKAGYEMDIISIEGGGVPVEPKSLSYFFIDKETKSYLKNNSFVDQLKNSISVKGLNPDNYEAIFFTGGHGVMWDFPDSLELQNFAAKIYEKGGIVSAVCHGVCGLFNIKLSSGERLIQGKKLTGFSNLEEYVALAHKRVPYFLEDELKLRGASYSKAKLPMLPYSVVDGRIVTGQNPNSTRLVAENLVKLLEN